VKPKATCHVTRQRKHQCNLILFLLEIVTRKFVLILKITAAEFTFIVFQIRDIVLTFNNDFLIDLKL